jgi:DNA mismatch repair protein MutS
MGFTTDKQTLDDLNIIGRPGSDSLYAIFNHTLTRGGAELLEEMFRNPLSKRAAIEERIRIIHYLESTNISFPFLPELFDTLEQYLQTNDERSRLAVENNTIARKIAGVVAGDTEYKIITNGIAAVIKLLGGIRELLDLFYNKESESTPPEGLVSLNALMNDVELASLLQESHSSRLSFEKVADYDFVIRFRRRNEISEVIKQIYQLDAYLTVAGVARKRGFAFPELLPEGEHALLLDGVYHPQVINAVANKFHITQKENVVFLTGANMAGKSTFMKTLGTALYLAHMGFPVAASSMRFSLMDGMYSTINLPDDLHSGNSHFYAEVMRVKKIARELASGKNLLVIFDELFRGTNVKDAFEGTVAITEAFAAKANCMFIVSSHITEAGQELKLHCPNIKFVYMPTRMDFQKPVYSYKLEQGITEDRHGMIIINNERILEIIRSRKNKIELS